MNAHEKWVLEKWVLAYGCEAELYDPATDGPETDTIFMDWVNRVLDQVALAEVIDYALSTEEYPLAHVASASWLDTHSHQFDAVHDELPIWEHRRE